MKTLYVLILLTLTNTVFGKIWIVDSNPGSASKDFTNLQEAHDGASIGDTLYLIGSGVSYITTKVTINKRLIIIGPGYFLNNPETQVSLAAAFLRLTTDPCNVGVEFAAGSEGSAMMGITHLGSVVISTNNIMIKRNHFANNGSSCGSHNRITISGSAIQIVQSYFDRNFNLTRHILLNPGNNNIRINNNFFIPGTGSIRAITAFGSSLEFANNIFDFQIELENALVQNNILFSVTSQILNNCVVRNNVSVGSNNLPSENGNILNVLPANIFVGTGTLDGQWKLKDGSPAIGSGYNGTDMGMFGGAEPYVLSGIPPIPTIYSLEAPLTGEKIPGFLLKSKQNPITKPRMHRWLYLFLLSATLQAQTITRIEYFFDNDPGFGNGIAIPITSAATITQGFTVPLGTVSQGFHALYIRAKDNNGLWSIPVIHPVYVQLSAQSASVTPLTRVEYFFDTDPGLGNGLNIPITSAVNITQNFTVPLGTVSEGFHALYIRAKDTNGLWSIPVIHPVFVQNNAQSAPTPALKRFEYFIDTDPGLGNAGQVALATNNITESIVINLTNVPDGFHTLYLRTEDVNGRWSLPTARPFYSANSGTEIVALEYFYKDIATQTPSEPRTLTNFLPTANLTLDFNAVLDGLLPGTDYEIRVTAIDNANKRSKQAVHAFATPAIICDPISSPGVVAAARCGDGSVLLSASGATATQNYQWYTSLTAVNAIAGVTESSFQTPVLTDTTTYFVSIQNGTCESTRTPVTAFINTIPPAPLVNNNSTCGINSTITLSASGGNNGQYRWYDVASGGTPLAGAINDTFITPPLATTTSYYVSINNGSCESARTLVTATINPNPQPPLVTASINPVGNALTICASTVLTLTAPSGFASYLWSTGETTQQISITANGNYSVSVVDGAGCTSPTSDAITITVMAGPCTNQPPVITSVALSTIIEGQVIVNLLPLISDADDNLDLSSLSITQQPGSGASATITNGVLQINYAGVSFSGQDQLTIRVCDVFGACATLTLEVDVIGDIEIYNAISPGTDGKNDVFLIQYIDILPDTRDNRVTIYNRWGSIVFEVENYNNTTNVFRGLNTNGNELPSGTYFYKIAFASGRKIQTGYLTLKR
ncbi:MAG: gliding motility-associated C-terminal domain-containing protein [Cyclobacteriaceae bacterium]|nr:gliding motility-associated C-terminal domain-containing protein [Cyclobacteriaceae bacterium]